METELMEFSFVSVPAQSDATVIARSLVGKAGRVLNSANSHAIAQVQAELDKCEGAHADALSFLQKASGHRARAMQHAQNIAASAGADDDDTADPDDTGDADVELAAAAARRKRLIEIAELSGGPAISTDRADRDRQLRSLDSADVGSVKAPSFIACDGGAQYAAEQRAKERARMKAVWRS
jgi:hypothetical protein